MNDADFSSVSNITPTGAVRLANVVTITTLTPHGLALNDRVQVSSVTDTSFNGTQTITSIPTSTTFTYSQIAANTSSGNGIVIQMIQGDVWYDAVLLPLVKKAYRKCQSMLRNTGSKDMTTETIITIPPGITLLNDSSNPVLPDDFLAPRKLWEEITGTANQFREMKSVDVIPDLPQSSYLGYWSWREDSLFFIGATTSIDVKIRYFRGLSSISDASSPLLLRGILDPVASYSCLLAANSRGNTEGGMFFKSMFDDDIDEFIRTQSHSRQYQPVRRAPYGGGMRRSR